MYSSREKKNVLLAGLCLLAFLITFSVFAEKLVAHKLYRFDIKVIRWIQSKIDNPNTRRMEVFTFLGSPTVVSILVVCSVILLWWKGRRREAAGMFIANAAGAGFNEILKYVFHRRRPDIHRLITARGYSFPSGHSMGSVMFYGTLSYFICRWTRSLFCKMLTWIAGVFMILMTGISRIYLGVHYPSDVIAGFTAGGAWLSVCLAGLHAIVPRREPWKR